MGRSPLYDESGLKKGPWTPEEDEKLLHYIQNNGHGSWRTLPRLAGLNRCGKSCRLRWTNYLRPDIKRGKFSQGEEQTILHLHSILGNKWSAIATHLPGRTDNEIKNFWNTHLKKRLIQMGFDPMTHRPRTNFFAALPQLLALASLACPSGQLQHGEAAALQAAKLQYLQCLLQSATTTITSSSNTTNIYPPNVEPSSVAFSPQGTPFAMTGGQMPSAFAETPVSNEANQGPSNGDHGFGCLGDSLPPLTDLSDVSNPAEGCSATSSFGGGASSPITWPEFFPDDPFITDFL